MNRSTLVCFAHKDYDGTTPPTLSCKNCCGIFIAEIKRRAQSDQNQFDATKWLQEKARDGAQAFKPVSEKAKAGGQPQG